MLLHDGSNLVSTTSRGASVLSTHSDIPPVTQTTVRSDFLHAFNVVTELGGNVLRKDLGVFTRLEVLLSIEEPQGDLELAGVLDDSDDLFDFIGGQFTSALVDIDFGLFANEIGETTSDTGNFCESVNDVTLALHVGIENTQNVLKLGSLHQ